MAADYDIAIIGAGFGGLIAALRFQKEGIRRFVVLERANDLGGTWRENTYPGCACDVASPLYSFADQPNPFWTAKYAEQAEIWAYMKKIAEQNRLYDHIQFNTDIVKAVFIASNGHWQLTDQRGNSYTATMIILATGPLNRPQIPDITGLETFAGTYFHSAQWKHDCDLTGKKVVVIGTGASAVQFIPQIAPIVSQLTVFQRNAAWVMPRHNRAYTHTEQRLFQRLPIAQRLLREGIYWVNEVFGRAFVGIGLLNKLATRASMYKLKKEVKDPLVRQKLTPNYTLGCKRVLVSDDYWPTFNRPNVALITDRVDRIEPTHIVSKSGERYPADVIIFGTGFIAADTEQTYVSIIGLQQQDLITQWRENGVAAYKGISVSGFPNLAFLLGPNTGLGNNSVLHIMDSQMNYIVDYWKLLQAQGETGFLDLLPQVQERYNQQLQQLFGGTVWASGCKSWYIDQKGRNTTLYPRLAKQYRRETQKVNSSDYGV